MMRLSTKKIATAAVVSLLSASVLAAPDVSIVFDGSGSMCGYFTPNDSNRVLLNLIQEAMIARGSSSGVQVFSLRQKTKNQINAKVDLASVSPNFQAQAEILDQQGKKTANGCAPFDGIGSNLELIFNAQTGVSNSNAIVLITDAQMQDADRDVFLNGYEQWAKSSIKEGKTPYAGYILAQVNFEGAYYSLAEPKEELKAKGYDLAKHNRPLALFWFAKGEEQLNTIYGLAKVFNNSKPVVQHLLPFVQASTLPLQAQPFSATPNLSQLLVDAGKITTIQRYDNDRSETIIRGCFKASIQNNLLSLQARPACADNKPFWEGVNSLKYGVQLKSLIPNVRYTLDGWTYNEKNKLFELPLERKFKEKNFKIIANFSATDSRSSLANWSMGSDFCPNASKENKACLAQLSGKTYQLDGLSQALVNRSKPLSEQLLVPIANTVFNAKLEYKK